jgi:hypothetical protein
MRRALWLPLTAAILLTSFAICRAGGLQKPGEVARRAGKGAAEAQPPAPEPPREPPGPPILRPVHKPPTPVFTAEAVGYGLDPDDAQKNAWVNAGNEIQAYLEANYKDLHWSPTPAQLKQLKVARDLGQPFPVVFEEKNDKEKNAFDLLAAGGVPWFQDKEREARRNFFGAKVQVELTSRHVQDLREQSRLQRAGEHHHLATLFLVGVMALLLIVRGYLRLEEMTRGFYTGLLRCAALGLLVLTGLGLWMMR